MKIAAMIHHFHGGTSLVTIPEGRNVRQACDDVWATLNDPGEPSDGDVIVNSGQPGDLISFVGIIPFAQRHAVVESTGFTTFMTTEFAVRHVADRTTVLHGARIYGLKPSPEPEDGQVDDAGPDDVHDPSEALHLSPSDLDPDSATCACCGHRPASIHESSSSFCHTCYEAGAARDDRDQS